MNSNNKNSANNEITDMSMEDIYELDLPKNILLYTIRDQESIKWKIYPLGEHEVFFYTVRYDIARWKRILMKIFWGYHFEKV